MADIIDFETGSNKIRRQEQQESLRRQEPALQRLAADHKKYDFFNRITPLLRPLKSYIKRRLRIAYLSEQIRSQAASSDDILDSVILYAYEKYERKPADLTLEQWLYQVANKKLEQYISREQSKEKRRPSTETLSQSELRSLEEMPITADAEGEPWFPEELDDSEIQPRELAFPADLDTPEAQLERREQIQQILKALTRLPKRDRLVFDLVLIAGFSNEAAAKILAIRAEEIPTILERAKRRVRELIEKHAQLDKKARVNRKPRAS